MYKVDYALFNITFEYVVKPIDVVVIGWEKDVNNTLTLKVHQRMDFVYRKEVIDNLVHWATDGTIINRLMELDDDFLNVVCYVWNVIYRVKLLLIVILSVGIVLIFSITSTGILFLVLCLFLWFGGIFVS